LSDTSFVPPGCHGQRSRANCNGEGEENRDDANAVAESLLHNLFDENNTAHATVELRGL